MPDVSAPANAPAAILIIDDDERFLAALAKILSDEFRVTACSNVSDVQRELIPGFHQAVILDFNMGLGSTDGHGILDEIRRKDPQIPIIVMSGYVSLEMAVGFLNRQIFGFFEKPLEMESLRAKLREAVVASAPVRRKNAGDLRWIPELRAAAWDHHQVVLTPTEEKIFVFFLKNCGQRVSRTELIQYVWEKAHQSRNNLDTHLLNLKKKVPVLSERLTVLYGEGFYFDP